ncbi:MAG TPA: MBL fold metallo-hydrolase [Gammaproteobacteria bacterium]|nr:MBL fold metallo-hydrolase [Gammaproteobacteria bacterium]
MKLIITPVTAFAQNCSCVVCEETGKAALIDPGGEPERLERVVQDAGGELEKILITHAHLDHAGAAQILADKLGIPIVGPHEEDRFLAESMEMQATMFGGNWPVQNFAPDQWLQQGDNVSVGTISFEVRHCPGHTPGHVVFHARQEKLVFAGDVLFKGSIGRTDFPRGDHATLIESIRRELMSLPDDVVVVPGHGPTTTIGEERRSNPFI